MHIAKECIYFYLVAFSVPYESKYKEIFNKKIQQITEAGLIDLYKGIEMDRAAKIAKSVKSESVL